MRNMKSIFGFITLLALVSLAGCGGSGGSGTDSPAGTTGITTGTAVDPYVKGAVFQEIAADGATVLQRESTPSDEYGVFTFAKALTEGSFVQLKISRKGMHEGAPFDGMLRRKVDSTVAGDMIVSPMTTMLTNGLSEGELIMLLSDAGLDLTMEDLYRDPMLGLDNLSGQVSDEQLKLLNANMAINQFMTTTGQFDAETTDLNDYNNQQLLVSLVKANQDLLNETEFARISSEISNQAGDSSPLLLEDLITSTVKTMRAVVSQAKVHHANGTLELDNIRQEVAVALQDATRKAMAIYLVRVGEQPPPMNVDGAAVFTAECAACHNLGSGGVMDLSGKGTAVIDKIANQHQGRVLSAEQLQALAAHVDSMAPTPTPDPVPDPIIDGQTLYDTNCAGCHKLGEYDLNGSAPDLGGRESVIADKINPGHRSTTLSTAEVTAVVDWVALNPALPVPTPDPTPNPTPDGIALYESECQGCHGPLSNNSLRDRSAAGIQQAIDANLGGMGMLVLTPEEVQVIADNLPAPAPVPDPDPTPTPVDGQVLYDNNCASCHTLGDYDVDGFAPELGGQGNLVVSKLEAGHQGLNFSVDERNALATWANANPVAAPTPDPTPIPDPVPTPVSGQAVYDNSCAGCHILGSYDTNGFAPELGSQGNLVITKIEAGHQGISLSVDELNALADWADANPAPTPPPAPTPDPVPTPVSGQAVYDNSCAGCHSVNGYDATGSPDLASSGNLVAPKLAAGHNGIVLTTEEEIATADFLDQYQAVAGGPDYSDCTACHAQPPNGSSFPNTAGSHATHSALPGVGNDCTVCHSGAAHDDVLDVAILQNYDAKTGIATANADSTCSTVSCHGGKTTPDWFNGSIAVETECKTCHNSGTAQYNGYFSGEHKKHVASKGYDCSVCHNTSKLNNGHFSDLSTSGFELSPAATIGGGSTRVGSYANGKCSSVQCHGSEKW